MKALTLSLVVVLTSAPAAFAADATGQPTLTLEGAERAVAAAIYARAHGAPGAAVTVVAAEGHTLCPERFDGTFAASTDVSIGKASSAATLVSRLEARRIPSTRIAHESLRRRKCTVNS